MKECSSCLEIKPLTDFYKGRRQCKSCRSRKNAEWYQKDPEKRREKHKEWRDNSKDYLKSKRKREWVKLKEDPDKLKAHNEKVRPYNREWAKTDKGRASHLNSVRNRRAKLKKSEGFNCWRTCLEIYNYQCAWCGSNERLELDHIQPLTRGGSNWQFNTQPLCRSCNSSKGNKIKDVYKQYISFKE